jgi:prophage tail gpP-like protein
MLNLELAIDNQSWSGWKSIRVVRSIKQAANTFDLELTDRWVGQQSIRPISDDSKCQLWIDGEIVISGYVFEIMPSYDAESHDLAVSGLSAAADLVDCSTKGRQFSGRTLLQIATDLAAPFGIAVSAETDIGGPFDKVALEAGQSIFDFLEELSRIRGVRLVSKPDGSITFIRTGTTVAPTALIYGQNIKAASGRFSSSERFSEYRVLGQTSGTDLFHGDRAAHAEALVKDLGLRYRPVCIVADGPAHTADCKTRSAAEKNRRDGEGQSVTYTVQGWRHETGLWEPNVLVDVQDPLMKINGRLLISQVTFSIDENGGRMTMLEVAPKEAFDLVPMPQKEQHAKNSGELE